MVTTDSNIISDTNEYNLPEMKVFKNSTSDVPADIHVALTWPPYNNYPVDPVNYTTSVPIKWNLGYTGPGTTTQTINILGPHGTIQSLSPTAGTSKIFVEYRESRVW